MFYLSNRKIKLFIISILLLIFCFILGIFDVKAEDLVYDNLYVPTGFVSAYYENNNNFDASSESYDIVKNLTLYNQQFYTPDWNSATTNITPKYYYFLRGNIPTTTSSDYFSFIFYSPYDLDNFSPSLYVKDSGNEYNFFSNLCSKAQTQTEGTNIFYICSFKASDIYPVNTQLISYGFDWSGSPSSTVFGSIYDYAISPLYSFTSDSDRVNFNTTMVNYFSSQTTDDPNGNPNNFDNIYSDYINSNDWGSNIGDWGHSFDSSQSTITDLITMPITLLRAIINNASTTCSSYTLGSIYNVALVLPCISLSTYLGSTLTTTIDLLLAGLIIYHISKKFVKIFDDFTNLRDNQINELYGGGK